MNLYDLILLAGALGTFLIVWQNWLSFQDTRVDLENRLRERLKGRGGAQEQIKVSVDEIRIYQLSRRAKLKWYFGRGIDSGVEVKLNTNTHMEDTVGEKIEEMFEEIDIGGPEVEFLGTQESPGGKPSLPIFRIGSTDESEIMSVVCAVPIIISQMDLKLEIGTAQSPMPPNLPDEYQKDIDEMI